MQGHIFSVQTDQPLCGSCKRGQPLNLSTSQPINLSTCHSLTLSLSQPLNISTYQPLSMSTTSHPLNLSTCHSLNLSTSQPPYKKVILIKLNLPGRQPKFANVKLRAGHYFQLRVFLEPGERNSTRKLFWPLQFGLQRNQEVSYNTNFLKLTLN